MPTMPFVVVPTALGTMTTGNDTTGHPATNLGEFDTMGMTWRSSGPSNLWVQGNFATLPPIDFISMIHANAVSTTTIRVRLGSSQAAVSGTAEYDSGVLPFISPSITRNDGLYSSHFEIGSPQLYPWWQIDIGGHVGDFEAAALVMGRKITPANWYAPGYKFGVKDLATAAPTPYGVIDRQPGTKFRTLGFTLGWQSEVEFETLFRPLLGTVGNTSPALWCFDPSATSYRQNKTYFGWLQGDIGGQQSVVTPTGPRFTQDFSILCMLSEDVIGSASLATGVFFDTTAGDTFTGSKFSAPSDPTVTVGANSVAFNSSTALSLNCQVKRGDASILDFCFDNFKVEAWFTINGNFPSNGAVGADIGTISDSLSTIYAGQMQAHPGNLAQLFEILLNNNSSVATAASGVSITAGMAIKHQYVKAGNEITHTVTYPSPTGARSLTWTQVYSAIGNTQTPTLFTKPSVRLVSGNFTMTGMRVSALYPNARFALVGDSITQGKKASVDTTSFGQMVRAHYPGQVLVAGAPSSQTSDWLPNIQDIVTMKPKNIFLLLGTNDDSNNVAMATREANYTSLYNTLTAAGIVVIALTVPPKGSSNVPIFNTWLKSQGWRYVDIYPSLLGTGTAMNATYDSGDGIHPNDAGHSVIYNLIAAYIVAQGL
ncbi:MAG TPA: SGNH/GDSL hydrolase family protein [Allosphingosinicella sp.]|nr:SGNH/GDSL hydrolase family protein [Allosphingosinicella sp.]